MYMRFCITLSMIKVEIRRVKDKQLDDRISVTEK